jgi:hypothetical protein
VTARDEVIETDAQMNEKKGDYVILAYRDKKDSDTVIETCIEN